MRMSSSSSSAAASSLRLAKMSTTPRPSAEEERDRPALRRASQLGRASASFVSGDGLSPRFSMRLNNPALGWSSPDPLKGSSFRAHSFDWRPALSAIAAAASYHPMTPEETRARLLYRDGL